MPSSPPSIAARQCAGSGWRFIDVTAGRDDRARLFVGPTVMNETITQLWAILIAYPVGPIVKPDAKPVVQAVRSLVPAPGARDFFLQVSARAVTFVSGEGESRIGPRPHEKILLCAQFSEFLAGGTAPASPRADTFLFPFAPFYSARAEDKAEVSARAARARHGRLLPGQLQQPRRAEGAEGDGEEGDRRFRPEPRSTSRRRRGWRPPSRSTATAVILPAGFAALAGDFVPSGTLPVSFPARWAMSGGTRPQGLSAWSSTSSCATRRSACPSPRACAGARAAARCTSAAIRRGP